MNISVQPLYDRAVVKRIKKNNTSKNGIIIPEGSNEKPSVGVVVAVGGGKLNHDGSSQVPLVRSGQKVIFGKWAGTVLDKEILEYLNINNEENDEFIVMKEEDIMLIIND